MAGTVAISVLADTRNAARALDALGSNTGMNALATGAKIAVGALVAASAAVVGVGTALAGIALKGGFDRALNIQDARASLTGLGHDTQAIDAIMQDALASVRGTAFGLGDAATMAGTAVAAGIEPGEALERQLTLLANASAMAKTDLADMGTVMDDVWTKGYAGTQELNRLQERGIPIWTKLGEAYNVSQDELRKMVTAGQIDLESFSEVLEATVGDSAAAMGDTWRGSRANMMAGMSRLGEMFVTGTVAEGPKLFQSITGALDRLGEALAPVAERFNEWIGPAIERTAAAIDQIDFSSLAEGEGFIDVLRRAFDALFDTDPTAALHGMLSRIGPAIRSVIDSVVSWLTTGGMQQVFDGLIAGRDALFNAAMVLFPVILDALVDFVPTLIDWIATTMIPGILDLLLTSIPLLLDVATALFTALVDAVVTVAPQLLDTLTGDVIPAVVTAIIDMLPDLLDAGIALFTALATAVVDVLPLLVRTVITILPEVITALLGMIPELLDTGVALFTALVDAVIDVLPEILSVLLGEVLPSVLSTVLGMLPDLLVTGIDLFFALVTAVLEILPDLIGVLTRDLLPTVLDTLVQMLPDLLGAGVELFAALLAGMIEHLPEIVGFIFTDLIPALLGAILEAIPQLLMAGISLMGGLIDGLKEALPDIAGFFQGEVEPLMLRSMSDVDLSGAGKQTMNSFVRGLFDGTPAVRAQLQHVTDNIPIWKGPPARDAVLLRDNGRLVMGGFRAGLADVIPDVHRDLAAFTADLARTDMRSIDLRPVIDLDPEVTSGRYDRSTGPRFSIKVETLTDGPEVGRRVVEAIRDYERVGGKR